MSEGYYERRFAAEVAELADAHDSGSCARKGVGVRVPPSAPPNPNTLNDEESPMPKYVIEREIPGAGNLSDQDLQAISQKSCSVLGKLGPRIQWVQSYVTDSKVYCIYIAPNEEMERE